MFFLFFKFKAMKGDFSEATINRRWRKQFILSLLKCKVTGAGSLRHLEKEREESVRRLTTTDNKAILGRRMDSIYHLHVSA